MPGHQTWQCVISSCGGFVKDNVYDPPLPKTLPELLERINTAIGKSHKTCLGGFGGNGSIAWTFAVSHIGHTSNAFKVTMKLLSFLFQMIVTSCISVQYLWKYGFAKSSDNLYAPCILVCFVFIWEQTANCATCSTNWLAFITEMKSVYRAVRTGSLNKAVCACLYRVKEKCLQRGTDWVFKHNSGLFSSLFNKLPILIKVSCVPVE